jgi:hypothetical protein
MILPNRNLGIYCNVLPPRNGTAAILPRKRIFNGFGMPSMECSSILRYPLIPERIWDGSFVIPARHLILGMGPYQIVFGQSTQKNLIWKKFNAKAWVGFAKKAGFKYIVAIAKHLDGFHLWNTKYSDFNIMHTPFGRDYLKELADACHAAGMKFGIYYCQRDFYQPDYAPVDTSMIEQISDPPYYRAKPGIEKILPGPTHQKYIDYQFNVVRELCSNYGKIDIFWFDACWWGACSRRICGNPKSSPE